MLDMELAFQKWWNAPVFVRHRKRLEKEALCSLASIPSSAQAFVLGGLTWNISRATLVKVKNVKAQEELANDLEAWGIPFVYLPETEKTVAETLPDPEMAAERLAVLSKLGADFRGILLATATGLEQPVPSPKAWSSSRQTFSVGSEIDREAWLEKLAKAGYVREAEVQQRGQFSVRGGVVDLFSWDAAYPVRIEWMGDEIVSLREFDPVGQRSIGSMEQLTVSFAAADELQNPAKGKAAMVADYLPQNHLRIDFNSEEETEGLEDLELYAHDFLHAPKGDFILQETRRELFLDHVLDWIEEKWSIAIFCYNEGEQTRLTEILRESGIDPEPIEFYLRPLLRGFLWPSEKQVVLSDAEIFGRYQTLRALRRQEKLIATRSRQNALDFSDWGEGDYVVHLHYGIAFYKGLQTIPGEDGKPAEVLVLEFAEQAKLYVPLEQAYLVSKYVGVGKRIPELDVLGGTRWERAKVSARKAVLDYAAELLRVQAERDTLKGFAFSADTPWQKEFEEAFVYEETEDQLKAIVETKRDMESERPMDRLICGDVGFGKTEVAIRAVFKAVMSGKQVAFLVPTTILAQQHYRNLSERFADYPIRVEMLSRFRTVTQQKKTLQLLKEGGVDVVVGTHRLISKDVAFKNLGLVIVDEEQRFGVVQKEKFKQMFRLVDVLTLSATPIPRTLYLSLTGAKDMSTIETPPANRMPVETVVSPYDERVIREAIERELARNGQVYFLHNRVQSIQGVAQRLKALVPHARIDIGHGQMDEDELEAVMQRFVSGETDILLSTTIIESGLDIPNANTIIIDRADRFGLADLYQLRGRVGRAQHKAYAYLMLPRHLMSVADARKRVNAIRQYSQLGAGFKIAMRDLEIRGAGNLLGTAQSGHIAAVGFELYCQLLKMAVSQLKGQKPVRTMECKLQIDFLSWQEGDAGEGKSGAFLPRSYMSESRWRIEGYRRLAEVQTEAELEALRSEWRDRYGAWPEPVELLLLANGIRILAAQKRIGLVESQGEKLILKRGQDFIMVGGKFPRLTASDAKSTLREIQKWITSLG